MTENSSQEEIVVTEDGKTLPTIDVLTGRAFLTGKSGSGKSTTCSVIAEELLEQGFSFLIVDADGEYFGLKERYQLLHVGGDEFADVHVEPENAERIARISLEENVPVILDVSGYDEAAVAEELIEGVVAELFQREKRVRKPYLLIVEEMQEYLPQQGGTDDLAALLERVAKRGRKRGLGICGISQRPSSVDKDFITQCDWMVWHKLTWENDLELVRRVLGADRATAIQEFDPGEAFLMTDWDDSIDRVRFRQKRTHDAGATPGLDQYDDRTPNTLEDSVLQGFGASAEAMTFTPEQERTDRQDRSNTEEEPAAPSDGELPESLAKLDLETQPAISELESEEELREALRKTRERNERLIKRLQNVERQDTGADNAQSASAGADSASDQEAPQPQPPSRPVNRSGVSGNILEFGELMMYLGKRIWFRTRMLFYKLRKL